MVGPEDEKQINVGLLSVALSGLRSYMQATLDVVITYMNYCCAYGNDLNGRNLPPQHSEIKDHSDSGSNSISNAHYYQALTSNHRDVTTFCQQRSTSKKL